MFCLFIVHFCILPKTLYEEDPIHFWKHKIWRCHIFFILHQHKSAMLSQLWNTHTQNLFLLAKLVQDGKMFGGGDVFPDVGETPSISSWRGFGAIMYYDYCQGKSIQQNFKSMSNCSGEFTTDTRNFSSAEWCLKTVTTVAVLCPLLPNNLWPQWSIQSKKTNKL